MIKQTINFSQFCDEWNKWEDRKNSFSYNGKKALFDYLEDYSEDIGEDIELDIVALCCEYDEYENLEEIQVHYPDIKSINDLKDNTTVLEFDGGIIIQQY